MKKIILSTILLVITINLTAQNTSPIPSGNTTIGNHLSVGQSNELWSSATALYINYRGNVAATHFWDLGGTNGKAVMSIRNNGKVGIGTSSPEAKLHIFNGNNSYGAILANANENAFSLYTKTFSTNPYSETFRLGLKYNTDENNGFISFYRGGDTNGGYLGFSTNGTEKMIIKADGKIGIGITNPDSKLSVNGKIHAKEVKVDLTGWPDYVFSKNYQLPSLKSVEKHIKENGHLANIPSAKKVAENGIELGEMNKRLLQKIEELTLYTIQQQKEIEAEKKKNKSLEKRMNKLETLIQSKIE